METLERPERIVELCPVVSIPIDRIEIDESINKELGSASPREMELLKESISSRGLVYPIVVKKTGNGKYKVYDGIHRMKVLKELGATDVPCKVLPEYLSDDEAKTWTIILNTARRELPLEKKKRLLSEVFTTLRKLGERERTSESEKEKATLEDLIGTISDILSKGVEFSPQLLEKLKQLNGYITSITDYEEDEEQESNEDDSHAKTVKELEEVKRNLSLLEKEKESKEKLIDTYRKKVIELEEEKEELEAKLQKMVIENHENIKNNPEYKALRKSLSDVQANLEKMRRMVREKDEELKDLAEELEKLKTQVIGHGSKVSRLATIYKEIIQDLEARLLYLVSPRKVEKSLLEGVEMVKAHLTKCLRALDDLIERLRTLSKSPLPVESYNKVTEIDVVGKVKNEIEAFVKKVNEALRRIKACEKDLKIDESAEELKEVLEKMMEECEEEQEELHVLRDKILEVARAHGIKMTKLIPAK